MKSVKIINRTLDGEVKVPSSKSVGHRLLICAALADGRSIVDGLSMSKDIQATMAALTVLGAKFERDGSEQSESEGADRYQVYGIGNQPKAAREKSPGDLDVEPLGESVVIHCSESGSTLRFLLPVGLAVKDHLVFTGEGRLVERPIDEYFPIFEKNDIQFEYDGRLPIALNGRLKPGQYILSGQVSSQYTTGMLLASPMLGGHTEIRTRGKMESKGYIDLTIDAMAKFGVRVDREGYEKFVIHESKGYRAAEVQVEGDYSQGAFWIVAGLIGSSAIRIKGLNPNSSQGDAVVLEITRQMGGTWHWENEVLVVNPSLTKGMRIDGAQCPDLIPILCVLATQSEGETRVINSARLRIKESDRIRSTVTELSKMGADIVETEDGMIINGKTRLKGNCEIDSWNDHRIVMAASIAATVCDHPISLVGYEAVQKSYPSFFKDFVRLGGEIHY